MRGVPELSRGDWASVAENTFQELRGRVFDVKATAFAVHHRPTRTTVFPHLGKAELVPFRENGPAHWNPCTGYNVRDWLSPGRRKWDSQPMLIRTWLHSGVPGLCRSFNGRVENVGLTNSAFQADSLVAGFPTGAFEVDADPVTAAEGALCEISRHGWHSSLVG